VGIHSGEEKHMNKQQLVTEVTAFINDNVEEHDGEVELGTAASAIETFINELEDGEDSDDDEDDVADGPADPGSDAKGA
jgi:hypothetical protein